MTERMSIDHPKKATPFKRFVRFLWSCAGRRGLYKLQEKECSVLHSSGLKKLTFSDPFLQALEDDDLLVISDDENEEPCNPVLKICFGFADNELPEAYSKRTYPLTRAWLSWLQLRGRKEENSECWRKYGEPCFDFLPGSLWMETMESSYTILIALNKLRNRRKNISQLKAPAENEPMEIFTTSGDTVPNNIGPHAIPHHLQALELFAVFAIRVSELGERQRRNARNRSIRIPDETLNAIKSEPLERRSRLTRRPQCRNIVTEPNTET